MLRKVSTDSVAIWKQAPLAPFCRAKTELQPVPSTMETLPVVMPAVARLAMPLLSSAMKTLTCVEQSQFALLKKRESSNVVRLTGGLLCC